MQVIGLIFVDIRNEVVAVLRLMKVYQPALLLVCHARSPRWKLMLTLIPHRQRRKDEQTEANLLDDSAGGIPAGAGAELGAADGLHRRSDCGSEIQNNRDRTRRGVGFVPVGDDPGVSGIHQSREIAGVFPPGCAERVHHAQPADAAGPGQGLFHREQPGHRPGGRFRQTAAGHDGRDARFSGKFLWSAGDDPGRSRSGAAERTRRVGISARAGPGICR